MEDQSITPQHVHHSRATGALGQHRNSTNSLLRRPILPKFGGERPACSRASICVVQYAEMDVRRTRAQSSHARGSERSGTRRSRLSLSGLDHDGRCGREEWGETFCACPSFERCWSSRKITFIRGNEAGNMWKKHFHFIMCECDPSSCSHFGSSSNRSSMYAQPPGPSASSCRGRGTPKKYERSRTPSRKKRHYGP